MKKTVLFLIIGLLSLVSVQKAFAIPALQLYSPAGEYINETWVVSDQSFELWVIAAQDVSDVYLTMAVPEGTGEIMLNGQAMTNFIFGNPGYAPHDVFPSLYAEYYIGNMIIPSTGADTIYNMVDLSEGSQSGKILKFDIAVSGYDYVHFDARGDGLRNNGKAVTFAPFSHDAESHNNPVPEPATLSLLGIGVVGLLGKKARRAK